MSKQQHYNNNNHTNNYDKVILALDTYNTMIEQHRQLKTQLDQARQKLLDTARRIVVDIRISCMKKNELEDLLALTDPEQIIWAVNYSCDTPLADLHDLANYGLCSFDEIVDTYVTEVRAIALKYLANFIDTDASDTVSVDKPFVIY